MAKPELPYEFGDWEDCRDYYALEAIFLRQHADRFPSKRNEARYERAARLAFAANRLCEQPLAEEGDDD